MNSRIWPLVATRIRHRLLLGVALSFLIPMAIGFVAKTFHQPGLDGDADKTARMIDFMTWGAIGFGLTTVGTTLLGVLIVASMKGPPRSADSFTAGDPAADDGRDPPAAAPQARP